MGCLIRIKEMLPSLTKTERRLAQYILENHEQVVLLSTQELAISAEVSTASVIRFAYRLHYRGFPALKLALASDQSDRQETDDFSLNSEDSYQRIIYKKEKQTQSLIEKLYQSIDGEDLRQAVKIISSSKKIYAMGLGQNTHLCGSLHLNLLEMKKMAIYYPDISLQQISLETITDEDVCIVIDFDAERNDLFELAQKVKKKKCKIIGITQMNAPIAKQCDYRFYIPFQKGKYSNESNHLLAALIIELLLIGLSKEM